MGTLHELPAKNNKIAAEQNLYRALRDAVDATVGKDASFRERELVGLKMTNEAARRVMEEDLRSVANNFGKVVEVNGVVYEEHEPGTVNYHSLCGALVVERSTYREVGVRNGSTIVPLELVVGMAHRTTPALAYRIALGYAKDHMRSCEEDMLADQRCPPSRSTLERIAKAIGTDAKEKLETIEPIIREVEKVPENTTAVSMGLDRTSIPMEEDVPPGEDPEGRRKKRNKPYEREQPPRINVNYRMGYVGTLSFHDKDADVLKTLKYAIGADDSPEEIVHRLMADLRLAVAQVPGLAVGVLQDGAPELWNLIRKGLSNAEFIDTWIEAIDRYHLNERLGKILKLLEPDPHKRAEQLTRWNDSLDINDNAIYRIRQWVRDHYKKAVADGDATLSESLEPHLTYLENNSSRMRYASLRRVGLPVGSGATEGACKSAVEVRTNGSGQRWRPLGLAAVLTLRSIHLSERLPRFSEKLSRSYQAEVRKSA